MLITIWTEVSKQTLKPGRDPRGLYIQALHFASEHAEIERGFLDQNAFLTNSRND